MALLICTECGGKVSSYATACPHCGCPAKYQNEQGTVITSCGVAQNHKIETTKVTDVRAKQVKNLSEWREIKNLVKSGHKNDAINAMIQITGADRVKCKLFADKMEKTIGLSADLILQEFPDQVETVVVASNVVRDNWRGNISESEKEALARRLAYPKRWGDIVDRICRQGVTIVDTDFICKDISALVNTDDIYTIKEIYRYIEHTREIPYEILYKNFPRQFLKLKTIPCTACSRPISTKAETCPHCGNPTGVHVCPKCGSTNTYVISRVDKAAMTFMFGRYAAHNVMAKYGCEDCKYTF